ncbi:hypothetical protein HYH03_003797 [Edaphochlamys debaryana]|uniref:RNA polymerase I-specific transcription initiation factor RRN3 n=1 Tax=Edaphochlamys debaryana TaxID=47281 RepID=A0A835YBZ6_9CHLO|nr:hypothetical protein HYH03_003797 [Edaphochlamys debaryana]|eukprot:KAG2498036.1 hypothetical protein HYH03_003797 [Edaphochlamys debaryana]
MARPAVNPELSSFVSDALLKKNKSYDELKHLLKECRKRVEQEPENEEAVLQLTTLILSVTANVSAIGERKHEALVSDILGIRLWGATPSLLAAVLDFTRNLVVANSAFTHTCLQLIVYSFTPPPAPPNPSDPSQDPHGPWRPSEAALGVHASLLGVLSRLLGLIPTAATNMLPLVVAQMPHKLRDRNTQCLYLSALFRIAEDRAGAPIREALLTAAVEHLLSLDVEIKWEDIVDVPTGEDEEEEEADDAVAEDIFELEGMLASELDINAGPEELAQRQAVQAMRHASVSRGGWEGAAAEQQRLAAQAAAQAAARPPVDEMANKMDSMMELAFEHISRRIAAGEGRALWDTLLSAFERTILNTHRSKFTQFLVFYTCMTNPATCSPSLVRLLLSRLRDTRQPPITRVACAAYLASFLARAAFLGEGLVVKTLQELAAFCVGYCASQGGGMGPSPPSRGQSTAGNRGLEDAAPFAGLQPEGETSQTQRHQVLYATVQAVLYVLCYHMQPLVGHATGTATGTGTGMGTATGTPTAAQAAAGAAAAAVDAAAAASAAGVGPGSERRQLAEAVVALVRGPVWQVLNHRLQPLAVCLPSVAAEFVHQAASLGLIDARPLLAKLASAAAGDGGAVARSQRPLEMFFPFDPYLLQRSSRYLQLKSSYVRWRHGHPQAAAGAGADADAGDSEDEDEQEGAEEGGAEGDRDRDDEDALSESSLSSSDGSESEDEDADLVGRSLPSDAILHDPTARLHGSGAKPAKPHPHGHGHGHPRHLPHPHPVAGAGLHGHHRGAHGRGRNGDAMMGTSYMSYASTETASQGDGAMSPYGMSPYEGGDMLVNNPLGASPGGACPMSLGTPVGHYMHHAAALRIGRR